MGSSGWATEVSMKGAVQVGDLHAEVALGLGVGPASVLGSRFVS